MHGETLKVLQILIINICSITRLQRLHEMVRETSCHTPYHRYNFIPNDLHSVEVALITRQQYSGHNKSESYLAPAIKMKAFLWLQIPSMPGIANLL